MNNLYPENSVKKLYYPDFEKNALIPAIVQDCQTGEILMLAYINKEAWDLTLKTNFAHYFSRSRNRIWKKGETSGHVQEVTEIFVDCDNDTVIYKIRQIGGAACHTGHRSCFFRKIENGDAVVTQNKIFDEEKIYGGN